MSSTVARPLAAYVIGVLHGAGGSAGVSILLVGATPGLAQAVPSLIVFAQMTAVSMALVPYMWTAM